jgi:hypothetical protein
MISGAISGRRALVVPFNTNGFGERDLTPDRSVGWRRLRIVQIRESAVCDLAAISPDRVHIAVQGLCKTLPAVM